jgi:hypothetical protein
MLSQVWGVLGRKNVREFKKKMKRNRHYLMTIKTSVSKLKKKNTRINIYKSLDSTHF